MSCLLSARLCLFRCAKHNFSIGTLSIFRRGFASRTIRTIIFNTDFRIDSWASGIDATIVYPFKLNGLSIGIYGNVNTVGPAIYPKV